MEIQLDLNVAETIGTSQERPLYWVSAIRKTGLFDINSESKQTDLITFQLFILTKKKKNKLRPWFITTTFLKVNESYRGLAFFLKKNSQSWMSFTNWLQATASTLIIASVISCAIPLSSLFRENLCNRPWDVAILFWTRNLCYMFISGSPEGKWVVKVVSATFLIVCLKSVREQGNKEKCFFISFWKLFSLMR